MFINKEIYVCEEKMHEDEGNKLRNVMLKII